MSLPLPSPLWASIEAFLQAGKTGQIVLDVKDGHVLAYKLTEQGRCEPLPVAPCTRVW